ncbi:MAG: selenide, water dikinase SelD, partial [Gemmatimonadota bacterium]
MGPEDLEAILRHVPVDAAEGLLVGLEAPDDAAVYRLDDDRAVAATIDFFTPLVDDPGDFGAIAAANALSDLYAMGARPIFALNVLAIPAGELPDRVVAEILRGAAEVCREAGIPVGGGHSIDDEEPKFGLVALGLVDPRRMYRKGGARPGDALVLGKALGTGVITTGIKTGDASPESAAAAVRSMRQLNKTATAVLDDHEVHAVTDVTGFGLLGHLKEVCAASRATARVRAGAPRL